MSVIKSTKEIKAFRCPVCGELIEISTESKKYVTVNGNLTWGESIIFIGYMSSDHHQTEPCRICVICLANILTGNSPRNSFADLFSFKSKIQDLGSAHSSDDEKEDKK